MKSFTVLVKIDSQTKDGNYLIKRACEGLESCIETYYGIRIRTEPSSSRVSKKRFQNFGTYNDYGKTYTLIRVRFTVSHRNVNLWKLKSHDCYQEIANDEYRHKVFCGVEL